MGWGHHFQQAVGRNCQKVIFEFYKPWRELHWIKAGVAFEALPDELGQTMSSLSLNQNYVQFPLGYSGTINLQQSQE